MYSSPKFFVPRVIVGLLELAFDFPAEATPAVSPIRSATPIETANAALAARRMCFRTISPPLEIETAPWTLRGWSHPVGGRALRKRQQSVREQRENGDADRRREHAGEAVRGLVVHDLAEAASACDSGDRRRCDHEDRRDLHAGEDERQAERQLHSSEDLQLGQAHPPRRLDHVAVDALDGEVRVRENRRYTEHDECHGYVPEADSQPGDQDADDRDARQSPADRGHPECEEEAAMLVPEPQADRQGDQERDPESGEGQLRRLHRLVEQELGVVRDELKRVDEERAEHQRTRFHGVSARWVRASSASAVKARRMASPPAATSSVRKMSGCPSASKIGPPRP